ncbi:MAG: phage Gp37/Gp68 family protein [Actinobacteria bacterium]|nr:phage Gp37/Gp68 family protein [Actinomycetota bacterium]
MLHQPPAQAGAGRAVAVMAGAPRHTFQILTKRPDRALDYLSVPRRLEDICAHWYNVNGAPAEAEAWPLPNVWVGTSVEDQRTADERQGHGSHREWQHRSPGDEMGQVKAGRHDARHEDVERQRRRPHLVRCQAEQRHGGQVAGGAGVPDRREKDGNDGERAGQQHSHPGQSGPLSASHAGTATAAGPLTSRPATCGSVGPAP